MRRFLIFLAFLSFGVGVSHAEILTLYSDNGIPATPAFIVDVYPQGGPEVALGSSTDISPPEGYTSFKLSMPVNSFAGWDLRYTDTAQDFSRFNSGDMRFWIYTNTANIQVNVGTVFSKMITTLGWTPTMANQWVELRVPLSGLDLTNMTIPFSFTATTGPSTFYVDDVRFVDSTVSPIFDVTLMNSGSNTPASTIEWGSVSLTSSPGWIKAPQYLQFSVDASTYPWGVQIYTNNADPSANPEFTGNVSIQNPAGLVDVSSTTLTIPLAWAVKMDASTTPPVAAEPNNVASDPNAYQWFYMKDKNTPNIAASSTTAFSNGDPFVTVKNNLGIHFTQGPKDPGGPVFGAQNPPNVIYFETNFATTISPNTYTTSTLTVEFYTL